MQEKIITLATPVFFVLIALELLVGLAKRRNTYRLNDAINSISLGILSQISGVFMQFLHLGIYAWLLKHFSMFDLNSDSVVVWASGLLMYDFCYYWLHRMGHEVNVLWAAHVVHHQSEDYNLSTALRQTSTGHLLGWVFYVPMALLGYPIEVFASVALIDLLYQFWVHTQQIGTLGWFDRVFVSPSNHRVHHAVNDHYLDKNYGGILILWDRLFGTYAEERPDVTIVYGTRSPLRSWNPVWANLEAYKSLWLDAWATRRWTDKIRIWFARPGWRPGDVNAAATHKPFDIHRPLYDPSLSRATGLYCLLQFTVILLITTHFLAAYSSMRVHEWLAYAVWLSCGLLALGGLMESRSRFVWLEISRILGTAALVLGTGSWFGGAILGSAVQGLICAFAIGSCLTVCLISKNFWSANGRLSNQ